MGALGQFFLFGLFGAYKMQGNKEFSPPPVYIT
jgi:hypothetical protein